MSSSGDSGHDSWARSVARDTRAEVAPEVPNYKIERGLGEGGMGSVYLAHQLRPIQRRVALKVIKLGMETKSALHRFEREHRALALMDHENIARVLDCGATSNGQPFFAMEFVPSGQPITGYCDANALTIRDRVGLVRQACSGVQHAHQKGILHRDLKPTNILARLLDNQHKVKIIDFGIARAVNYDASDCSLFTEHGTLVGTPGYVSPEQARGATDAVDTRTDIYSLGVILYELACGELPFASSDLKGASPQSLSQQLSTATVARLSTRIGKTQHEAQARASKRSTTVKSLRRDLRKELEWITLRAMHPDPNKRYATAQELRDDLGRYLTGQPVCAGPRSYWYPFGKFAQRHRWKVALLSATAVLLVVAFILTYSALQRAEAKTQDANQLALHGALKRAIASERALYPATPEIVPALDAWLAKYGTHMADTLPLLRARRDELRLRGQESRPGGQFEPAEWHFETDEDQFWHDALADLIDSVQEFVDPMRGLVVRARDRRDWALATQELCTGRDRDRWTAARLALLDADGQTAHRDYGAFPVDLRPQPGLVPLGMNPATKLWEFYHLASARQPIHESPHEIPIPGHAPDGSIAVGKHTGIVFVLIPGVTTNVTREAKTFQVTLDPFLIARHELTQGQWRNLSHGKPWACRYHAGETWAGYTIDWTHPIETVSWLTCRSLLERYGLAMPTELQWLHAARGRSESRWWTGDDLASLEGAANLADGTAFEAGSRWPGIEVWRHHHDGHVVHAPVDSMQMNAYGLYHVHGNVHEFCADTYAERDVPVGFRASDGLRIGPESAKGYIVFMGGGFMSTPDGASLRRRHGEQRTVNFWQGGVRPARRLSHD